MSTWQISEQQRALLVAGIKPKIISNTSEKMRLKRLADRGLVSWTRFLKDGVCYHTTKLGRDLIAQG